MAEVFLQTFRNSTWAEVDDINVMTPVKEYLFDAFKNYNDPEGSQASPRILAALGRMVRAATSKTQESQLKSSAIEVQFIAVHGCLWESS